MAYSGNGTLLFKVLDMKSISSKANTIDIGISEANRKKIAQGLSVLLADSYTLYLMTRNFHWNVTGPQFNSLHTMFMLVCPRPRHGAPFGRSARGDRPHGAKDVLRGRCCQ